MKPKPSSGTGMLSAAGLSGTGKPKTVGLAPPPGTGKIRSPLPPPPNDPAAARMTSGNHGVGDLKVAKENTRHGSDSLSDLSPLEVCISSDLLDMETPAMLYNRCTFLYTPGYLQQIYIYTYIQDRATCDCEKDLNRQHNSIIIMPTCFNG